MFNHTKPTVALFGATGRLGKHILTALLSPTFRSSYRDVIVFQRPNSSTSLPSTANFTTRNIDDASLASSLQDVNVVISAIGPTGHGFKDNLINAMAASPALKLYIPSEFGVDHTVHDFRHVEWDHKKLHYDLAQKFLIPRGVQVLRIYVGLFLEESIGPWFGFHTSKGRYECIGSADTKVSYTSLEDAGKVVAQCARTEMVGILEGIHVGGDTVSVREVAEVMEKNGAGKIEIEERDLEKWKTGAIEEGTSDPSKYLRFLMGEGNIEHQQRALGNDNEIVNPGQTLWKWRTMKDLAEETEGRPWAELDWDEKMVS